VTVYEAGKVMTEWRKLHGSKRFEFVLGQLVVLDGHFTIRELQAIIVLMERN